MANEGSTKPTYSELEAENLRVRGLLQRIHEAAESKSKGNRAPATLELAKTIMELAKAGAESADIGKLDTAEKSGKVSRVAPIELWKACKAAAQEVLWSNISPEELDRPHVQEDITDQATVILKHIQALLAGSAETGGEKADYDYLLEKVTMPLYVFVAVKEFLSDWRKGDFELSTLASLDAEAIESAIERWASDPNFRSSPQNEAVSTGVEGAHAGTAADKSDSANCIRCAIGIQQAHEQNIPYEVSNCPDCLGTGHTGEAREPEKLNNAQKICTKCRHTAHEGRCGVIDSECQSSCNCTFGKALAEYSLSQKCAKCPYDDRDPIHDNRAFPNYHKFESSLSSPPEFLYTNRFPAEDSIRIDSAASPELLPTQLPPDK